MHQENPLFLFEDSNPMDAQPKHSNGPQQEPFQILYNARSIKSTKSRKASYSKLSELPQKLKKPRKMTLPIQTTSSFNFNDEFAFETHSDRDFPLSAQSPLQLHNQTQQDISEMDLEKGIQYGIVEESDLDKDSWFGLRNQNPEFESME